MLYIYIYTHTGYMLTHILNSLTYDPLPSYNSIFKL